ncbi:hypothetical protein FOJ82_03790 [Tessaracoccus rhinocerotis]|uniref:Uncharacterized protein n=1 Tax=Tessaracoccus rhinocerotis TaxID=1689449 RepID=A0A553K5L9_9ACTN|nr:hypothetical protein [Tessaracoccus rhinocerotis]TRY20005.1 hypothetical protein FOJ82_03790 [Tessaracoccus rhinocerotis]
MVEVEPVWSAGGERERLVRGGQFDDPAHRRGGDVPVLSGDVVEVDDRLHGDVDPSQRLREGGGGDVSRPLDPGRTLQAAQGVDVQVHRDAQLGPQLVQRGGDGAAEVATAAVGVVACLVLFGRDRVEGWLGGLLQEAEGVGRVGQDAQRPGAQDLLGGLRRLGAQDLGDALDRCVEVAGVEGLEPPGEVHGALVEAPDVHSELRPGPPLPCRSDLGSRVGDLLVQTVERGGPAVAVLGTHPAVGDLLGHGLRQVLALARRRTRPIRGHPQLAHLRVQARMAGLEVHGVGDPSAGSCGRAAEQPCHLQTEELRHARGAVAHRDLLLHEHLDDVVLGEVIVGGQLGQQHDLARGHELGELLHLEELLREGGGDVFHV